MSKLSNGDIQENRGCRLCDNDSAIVWRLNEMERKEAELDGDMTDKFKQIDEKFEKQMMILNSTLVATILGLIGIVALFIKG